MSSFICECKNELVNDPPNLIVSDRAIELSFHRSEVFEVTVLWVILPTFIEGAAGTDVLEPEPTADDDHDNADDAEDADDADRLEDDTVDAELDSEHVDTDVAVVGSA